MRSRFLLVAEVVDAGERAAAFRLIDDLKKCALEKELRFETASKHMPRYYKHTAPSQTKPGKAPRWLHKHDERVEHVTSFLMKHKPRTVELIEDAYNGRWRVVSRELCWRSISWTKRGFKVAVAEVLYQAWQYHKDSTGRWPPFCLEELLEAFEPPAASSAASSSKDGA